MELRDFFKIFVVYKKLFWGIIVFSLILGISFYFVQYDSYKTILTLNTTRDHVTSTKEYDYDSFYRLQADEKFSDTIVAWMKSAFIQNELQGDSFTAKNISAKRLSPQVVETSFITATEKEAKLISKKIVYLLNKESEKLNHKQNNENWFIIVNFDAITKNNNKSMPFMILVSLFCGFFIAFWVVIIKYYIVGHK